MGQDASTTGGVTHKHWGVATNTDHAHQHTFLKTIILFSFNKSHIAGFDGWILFNNIFLNVMLIIFYWLHANAGVSSITTCARADATAVTVF